MGAAPLHADSEAAINIFLSFAASFLKELLFGWLDRMQRQRDEAKARILDSLPAVRAAEREIENTAKAARDAAVPDFASMR